MKQVSPHTFHIPVMGTGFSIDTPLKVAKYGINSVVSIMDDKLIEQMREYHSNKNNINYEKINGEDARAKRITEYLNLMNTLVQEQVEELKNQQFEEGNDITKYFEMLPEGHLRRRYVEMTQVSGLEKITLQDELREQIVPGSIDVNIMTKIDRKRDMKEASPSDALAALRGYVNSDLESSIVLSTGVNMALFRYMGEFNDFKPNENGHIKKKIILKVSDFDSAFRQSKMLAKFGLYMSEYRIESGINCGGHAFPEKGKPLGHVLKEFKERKDELLEINQVYTDVRVTVQGGIGTAQEDSLLLEYVDGTGWATPFLLVPEVVNVDSGTLELLLKSKGNDVYLSDMSPFGIPFSFLRGTASEIKRIEREERGMPGSPCSKGYLKIHRDENGDNYCPASKEYINSSSNAAPKSCLCEDLGANATLAKNIDPDATPVSCPGPNIVYFSEIATLKEMIDYIYGRENLSIDEKRPNMFIKEMQLFVDYHRQRVEEHTGEVTKVEADSFFEYRKNLLGGVDFYREDIATILPEVEREKFYHSLVILEQQINDIKQLKITNTNI